MDIKRIKEVLSDEGFFVDALVATEIGLKCSSLVINSVREDYCLEAGKSNASVIPLLKNLTQLESELKKAPTCIKDNVNRPFNVQGES